MRYIYTALTLIAFCLLIYDFGYDQDLEQQRKILLGYFFTIGVFSAFEVYRLIASEEHSNIISILRLMLPFATLMVISYAWVVDKQGFSQAVMRYEGLFVTNVLLLLFFELAFYIRRLYVRSLSPAALFAGSFLFVIAAGTFLLMLPNATVKGISFTDALFTSTSAVCVTGLAVLDTGKDFTRMGQIIITLLIQLGGLGMLTLTTFFAYFFKGGGSFQENILVRDFLSSDQLGGLLELSLKIVAFTLGIEFLGAVFIFYSLPEGYFATVDEKVFFAFFHGVSAFCNAGFSTLSAGLAEGPFRFAYNLHLIIALLLILGGLGFNIIFNVFRYIPLKIQSYYYRFLLGSAKYYKTVRLVTLNTKIVLYTTLALILSGTGLFFILEYNSTLQEHASFWGKLVTAFFGAVTPRTAGFNTVDMTALTPATVMLTIMLMWIGASPASTGGGVKTSTFALAMLNIISTVRSRNRIELGSRQVPQYSVNRAFAIISLSLLIIGLGILLLTLTDKDLGFMEIVFEVVSAYSTVGLSLGITPRFTDPGKIVLVVVMFVGRVGSINLLIAMLRQVRNLSYRYPEESVLIN